MREEQTPSDEIYDFPKIQSLVRERCPGSAMRVKRGDGKEESASAREGERRLPRFGREREEESEKARQRAGGEPRHETNEYRKGRPWLSQCAR